VSGRLRVSAEGSLTGPSVSAEGSLAGPSVSAAGSELRVANTGAPLDAAGVAALASLRASAKRDADSVGRFGVGFAAVLALSDEPRVVSAGGGVRFSAATTAVAVAELPGPAAELARRDGQLPVLRLVWPVEPDEPPVPAGFTTEVRLPLRAGTDVAELLRAARVAAPDLLLALPDLAEIAVDDTVLRRREQGGTLVIEGGPDGSRAWRVARRAGRVADDDVAALAVEQRARRDWSVTWALPLDGGGRPAPLAQDVVHAPTATAEPVVLPARLLATLPLEPDRRRVRPGPAADRILAEAGAAYLELVRAVAPADRAVLVPEPGFARSELDGRLRELLLDRLRGAAWLPGSGGDELVPARAEWLDVPGAPDLPGVLAAAGPPFAALLAGGPPPAALGVRRLGAAEMADRLLGLERPDAWWRAVYAALAPAADTVPGLLDELRALPVPVADRRVTDGPEPRSRTVAGPATVLLPVGDGEPVVMGVAELGLPGLHLVSPDAVHPLLARLGATPADATGLLDHPALREAVVRSVDDAEAGPRPGPQAGAAAEHGAAAVQPPEPSPLATAVLGLLVELGPGAAAARPWLAALALPDTAGRPARADELMLPDAALRPLLAGDSPVGVIDAGVAAAVPRDVLTGLGVLDGFAVLVDDDPVGADHDLDDEERWWDIRDGDPPAMFVAVRDLDLVDDAAWPAALRLLAAEPATRAAVLDPDGYTGWWLTRHARLHGRRPGYWRLPSATALAALHDPVEVDVDEPVLAAIGVRADLDVRGAADAADLLARLADPARRPTPALAAAAHAALAAAVVAGRVDPAELEAPEHVRALDGTVADAADAVVLDAPWCAAVLPDAELVAGGDAAALADLLDLPLASDVVDAEVEGTGEPVRWAELSEVVVACHTLGVAVPAGEVHRHDVLTVRLSRPGSGRREVPGWRDAAGRWHASDPLRALPAVLAAARTEQRVAR
jgi:hypothetical protein